MLLFERRGEKLGFRLTSQPVSQGTALNAPELNGNMDSLKQAVVDMLVAQGLYRDEAEAMFETWRDSWFEEGSRLLYLVPRAFVDSVLPLSINPAPAQTVRVFVGRLELITSATQKAVEEALVTRDRITLARYGRFLMPIVNMIASGAEDRLTEEQIGEYYSIAGSVQTVKASHGAFQQNAWSK